VLGATAHVASKRGQARGAAEAAQAPPEETAPQTAAPPAQPASPVEDQYSELMKLKELLDAGVLTQEEFDAQKQEILAS